MHFVVPCYSMDRDEHLARRLQAREHVRANAAAIIHVSSELLLSPSGNYEGQLLRFPVPPDNSCLFSSIRYVLYGQLNDSESDNSAFRNLIVQQVIADPRKYTDAVLGVSSAEYCEWILRPTSWGGAIELSILSSYYQMEIDVIDVKNGNINRFGEDKNYDFRVFLIYDGSHYDPLYLQRHNGDPISTIFPSEETGVFGKAMQIANAAKARIFIERYTSYPSKCLICNARLLGPRDVDDHFQRTGHCDFDDL